MSNGLMKGKVMNKVGIKHFACAQATLFKEDNFYAP